MTTTSVTYDTDSGTLGTSHQKTGLSFGAGLHIACFADLGVAQGKVTSITDSASNTWAVVARPTDTAAGGAAIWSTAVNASAITSITFNMDATGYLIAELIHNDTASSGSGTNGCDVKATNSGTSASPTTTGSGTPSTASSLVVGIIGSSLQFSGPTMSAGALTTAGGTFVTHNNGGGGGTPQGITGRNELAAATAQTLTATFSASTAYLAAIAVWKLGGALPPHGIQLGQAVKRSALR